jgi:hypothetical protein
MLTPSVAGAITQSGGVSVTYAAVGTPPTADATTALAGITYSGGTPTSSGTLLYGLVTNWGDTNSGCSFSIPVVGGTTYTGTVNVGSYGMKVLCTASLANGSAADVTYTLDSGAAVTTNSADVKFTCTPASNTTFTITVLANYAYTATEGNAHFMGAWFTS